jgi:hypothetical protein
MDDSLHWRQRTTIVGIEAFPQASCQWHPPRPSNSGQRLGLQRSKRYYSWLSQTARLVLAAYLTCWVNTISRAESSRIRSESSPKKWEALRRSDFGSTAKTVSRCVYPVCGKSCGVLRTFVGRTPLTPSAWYAGKPGNAERPAYSRKSSRASVVVFVGVGEQRQQQP